MGPEQPVQACHLLKIPRNGFFFFFFFGSKISKGCFDMKTLGLESQKALELAGLLG